MAKPFESFIVFVLTIVVLSCITLLTIELISIARLNDHLKVQKSEILEQKVKLTELNSMYEEVLKIGADKDAVISDLRETEAQNKDCEIKRLKSSFNQSPIITQGLEIDDNCEFLSGIRKITQTDGESFSIPYSKHVDGACWVIIQRRMDDYVDFYRNWKDYREGFGDLRGSFFIGLDKLYRMLSSRPHKLFIQLTDFDNDTRYALYDNFMIENEAEKYKLKFLGNFSGDTEDSMRVHENQKFSTYDDINHSWGYSCPDYRHGGWWYNRCANANLNGRYYTEEGYIPAGVFWDDDDWHKVFYNLKRVEMRIKPKSK